MSKPKRAPSRTWDCPRCHMTWLGGGLGPHTCDCGATLVLREDGREPEWNGEAEQRGGAGRGGEDVAPYSVLLADPPWYFRNYAADAPGVRHARARGAQKHYPTMLTDDLCDLSVPAADDAVLFLWACWPTLPDALRVIEAWGFKYKSIAWVWVKLDRVGMGFFHGMGYYTRANSEPCLLAMRGNLPKPKARDVQALIVSPIHEHSRKPDDQYRKIERLYPQGPYLELFARRRYSERWSVWSNEVESDVQIASAAP